MLAHLKIKKNREGGGARADMEYATIHTIKDCVKKKSVLCKNIERICVIVFLGQHKLDDQGMTHNIHMDIATTRLNQPVGADLVKTRRGRPC